MLQMLFNNYNALRYLQRHMLADPYKLQVRLAEPSVQAAQRKVESRLAKVSQDFNCLPRRLPASSSARDLACELVADSNPACKLHDISQPEHTLWSNSSQPFWTLRLTGTNERDTVEC
jgi:hypothetical protein